MLEGRKRKKGERETWPGKDLKKDGKGWEMCGGQVEENKRRVSF